MHIIFIILLIFFFIFSVSIVGFSLYVGISPMPSSDQAAKRMISAIPYNVRSICELGSGWGGVCFRLAKAFPNAKVYAFEISYFPWLYSKICQKIKGTTNLYIFRKDFFSYPLDQQEVVVCYLYPKGMANLKFKCEKELQEGAWVISNTFSIPGWTPIKVFQSNAIWQSEVFVYRFRRSLKVK